MNLFLELRRHGKLAEKRHPMYEKSKFGKFWMYFMSVFWAGYLIFFGTTFAFAFDGGAKEAYHVMNSGLIFILALDFLLRLPFLKTPTQEVKPYLLLPIKRSRLIDFLLLRSGLNSFNLLWLFLFVPFAIITVTKFYSVISLREREPTEILTIRILYSSLCSRIQPSPASTSEANPFPLLSRTLTAIRLQPGAIPR